MDFLHELAELAVIVLKAFVVVVVIGCVYAAFELLSKH